MNKNSVVGVVLTVDEALAFWSRCKEASEAGYSLNVEEKQALMKSMKLGQEITLEDLRDLCKEKKTLVVRSKGNESND